MLLMSNARGLPAASIIGPIPVPIAAVKPAATRICVGTIAPVH